MNNKDYWSNRLDKIVNSLMNKENRDTIKFLKFYKDSLTEVQSYINVLYSKYSTEGNLTLTDMYKYNRYNQMVKEINSIISTLGKEEKKYMTNELKDIYSDSYVKTGKILTQSNAKIDFNIIPKDAIEKALTYPWSGDNYSSRLYKNRDKLAYNLQQTITQGLVQGKSISDMNKDLKNTMDIGATNSRRLICTESMHIMGSSHHDIYTKAGIEKVQFITAHDDRVCEECDAMDGEIFDINDAPMIPQHPNSRSINIPYIE